MKESITESLLYDFTLDWAMNSEVPRSELIKLFKDYGWSFTEFKEKALSRNWYVKSMGVLNERNRN